MNTLLKAITLLTPREIRQGMIVLLLAVGMALLETIGLISVMPFLSLLGDPGVITTNKYMSEIYLFVQAYGITSVERFLILLGFGSFSLIIFSAIYKLYTHHIINNFIGVCQHNLSLRLFESYLKQPYSYFIKKHSADMAKNVLSQVESVIGTIYRPIFTTIAQCFVLLAVVTLLIIVDPLIAVLTAASMGGLYLIFFLAIKKKIATLGVKVVITNNHRFKVIGEAFSGIKEIKFNGCESSYLNRFETPSQTLALAQATNLTLSLVPKYVIEALAFGGLIGIILFIMMTSGGYGNQTLGKILPVIGLYAFAAYRLQPVLQAMFSTLANLKFGQAAVDDIYSDIHQVSGITLPSTQNSSGQLQVQNGVALQNISYSYTSTDKHSLSEVNIEIPRGSSLGIVGKTGSGKTTLVDVLLGLLRPTDGDINVDGLPISEDKLPSWKLLVGYVPQQTHVYDATVAENIAFGVGADAVDYRVVEQCARLAQVHEFISNLPQKYQTMAGESGVRFSGGQRQRIGIARALYRNPSILVFDEATSALDTVTELEVMRAINQLSGNKTIIMIAHRLSTVKNCSQIVFLEDGKIIGKGTYGELLRTNEKFRNMAGQQ